MVKQLARWLERCLKYNQQKPAEYSDQIKVTNQRWAGIYWTNE